MCKNFRIKFLHIRRDKFGRISYVAYTYIIILIINIKLHNLCPRLHPELFTQIYFSRLGIINEVISCSGNKDSPVSD